MTTLVFRFFIFWYICGLILLAFDLLPVWLEWANTVFLLTAGGIAGIYFTQLYGYLKGIVYSVCIIIISMYVEHLGVTYNFLFGSYEYGNNFGLKLFDTPITIGFAWLLVIGSSHELARGITLAFKQKKRGINFVLTAGLITVTMDLILDPVAYKIKHYWIWEDTGIYYGIPISNFTGWFLLACLLHGIGLFLLKEKRSADQLWERRMQMTFGLINLMFITIALTGKLYLAALLVGFLTVFWYSLYYWRVRTYAQDEEKFVD